MTLRSVSVMLVRRKISSTRTRIARSSRRAREFNFRYSRSRLGLWIPILEFCDRLSQPLGQGNGRRRLVQRIVHDLSRRVTSALCSWTNRAPMCALREHSSFASGYPDPGQRAQHQPRGRGERDGGDAHRIDVADELISQHILRRKHIVQGGLELELSEINRLREIRIRNHTGRRVVAESQFEREKVV